MSWSHWQSGKNQRFQNSLDFYLVSWQVLALTKVKTFKPTRMSFWVGGDKGDSNQRTFSGHGGRASWQVGVDNNTAYPLLSFSAEKMSSLFFALHERKDLFNSSIVQCLTQIKFVKHFVQQNFTKKCLHFIITFSRHKKVLKIWKNLFCRIM